MSKKSPTRSLVIVESPAKAKTIERFLGKEYNVLASVGHIRDLPKGAKELPEKYKKEEWAYLGVNVNDNFEPVYVVPSDKKKQIKLLKDSLKEADTLYLATDEDREGEAISWHLCEELKPKVPVFRLVFHEITKSAIEEALKNPREIDENLVKAQETRRIVDRLYGFDVSSLLWHKIAPKLSAGRVQSVAVRLVVERERERMAFVPATYWDILGSFFTDKPFQATLESVGNKQIPSGKDFDPNTGKLKSDKYLLLDEPNTIALVTRLKKGTPNVKSVENKPYSTRPYAPFTTSTLQQEANRKFGFTARRTMSAAQSLYENGYITYMRTDSTNLSSEALTAARSIISQQYGKEYLPEKPRFYQTKVKNAQEAHEAIRPAGGTFKSITNLTGLSDDERKIYELIWKRTVASQMTDCKGHRMTISIALEDALFSVSGKTIDFPGYLRAYVEGSDDPEAELADREIILPSVKEGQKLTCTGLEPKSHTTKPSGRYTEAALTRTLEEKGIGRPSTYASILETILNRQYVIKKNGALVPTFVAFAVSQLLEKHLPDLVDYDFTAHMEDQLDAISRGEMEHVKYLKEFYFGGKNPGLKTQLTENASAIDARAISTIPIGKGEDALCVRVGRFGPYVENGEKRTTLPDDLSPDELTVEKIQELLRKSEQGETPLGNCPDTGKAIFVKAGRFGPYVQRGTSDDGEKPQYSSLLKGMEPENVDLDTALKLLSLPRDLGANENGEHVFAQNGRFGPYIQCGKESRSLPNDISPLDVTLEQALTLLSQPKYGGGKGRAAAKKEPIRTFSVSPVTGNPVLLMDGRYGAYITDGETNATIPKNSKVEELTFEESLALLAERVARGPSAKKPLKKKATKKAIKKAAKKR